MKKYYYLLQFKLFECLYYDFGVQNAFKHMISAKFNYGKSLR
jgi:hypothetical protein